MASERDFSNFGMLRISYETWPQGDHRSDSQARHGEGGVLSGRRPGFRAAIVRQVRNVVIDVRKLHSPQTPPPIECEPVMTKQKLIASMTLNRLRVFFLTLTGMVLAAQFGTKAGAQTFQTQVNDLFLTLRKTGINQENYEALVDIGPASNFINAAVGTKLNVKVY